MGGEKSAPFHLQGKLGRVISCQSLNPHRIGINSCLLAKFPSLVDPMSSVNLQPKVGGSSMFFSVDAKKFLIQ